MWGKTMLISLTAVSFCYAYVYQTIILYTLNMYNFIFYKYPKI